MCECIVDLEYMCKTLVNLDYFPKILIFQNQNFKIQRK